MRDCFVLGFMPVVNAWLFSKYLHSVGLIHAHNATSVAGKRYIQALGSIGRCPGIDIMSLWRRSDAPQTAR